MTDFCLTRRQAFAAATGGVITVATPAAAAPVVTDLSKSFDAVVDAIAEVEDYADRIGLLKELSQRMRDRFRLMLIHDYVADAAATCLEEHVEPAFLARHGVLNHHSLQTATDLREALTGKELHRRTLRIDYIDDSRDPPSEPLVSVLRTFE